MELNQQQKLRVTQFIEDKWVDGNDNEKVSIQNLTNLLNSVETAYELDCMVSKFNWDCGIDALKLIIEHPLIDSGTILKAYWLSGPGYFSKYENESEIESHEKDHWEAVQYLQNQAIKSASKPANISFDPNIEFMGIVWVTQYEREENTLLKNGKEAFFVIPESLKKARK